MSAKFQAPVLGQEDQAEEDDLSSNASETLLRDLDDLEDDAENVPPNFVPETPQTVKPTNPLRGKPSLPDQSFLPESQSSPLPSSISAILQPSLFQVPESPSSDLNDSSFIGSSQQTSSAMRRTNIRGKSSTIASVEDTLDSEEPTEPTKLGRVDTNKLNNLMAAVRKEKGDDDELENSKKEDLESDDENDKSKASIFDLETQASILEIETQIVGSESEDEFKNSEKEDDAESDIKSKVSNSQIIAASTQFLVSKLDETKASIFNLETQASILGIETQIVGSESEEEFNYSMYMYSSMFHQAIVETKIGR